MDSSDESFVDDRRDEGSREERVEDRIGVTERLVRVEARERRQDAPETTLDLVSTRGDSGLSLRARAARISALSWARWTGEDLVSTSLDEGDGERNEL